MDISKVDRKNESCDFCNVSELSVSGNSLIYPYSEIYKLATDGKSGVTIKACPDCMKQLQSFTSR